MANLESVDSLANMEVMKLEFYGNMERVGPPSGLPPALMIGLSYAGAGTYCFMIVVLVLGVAIAYEIKGRKEQKK